MMNTLAQQVREKMNGRGQASEAQAILIPQGRMNRQHGYVEHEVVMYRGVEVGRIQTRVERGETTVLTISEGNTRRGRDIRWLLRMYDYSTNGQQWLGQRPRQIQRH